MTTIARLRRVDFSELAGWRADDHSGAIAALRRTGSAFGQAPPKTRRLGVDGAAIAKALRALSDDRANGLSDDRAMIEAAFIPYEVLPGGDGRAFFTEIGRAHV